MKVTVYGSSLSPFVEKVVRGLSLKGVGSAPDEPKSPTDLRKWNPQTGKMPVVAFDGEKVFDSTFILRRLDQLVPKPPLLADDPVAAANQRQLEDWADESLYWYVMAFSWTPTNAAAVANRNLSMVAGLPAAARGPDHAPADDRDGEGAGHGSPPRGDARPRVRRAARRSAAHARRPALLLRRAAERGGPRGVRAAPRGRLGQRARDTPRALRTPAAAGLPEDARDIQPERFAHINSEYPGGIFTDKWPGRFEILSAQPTVILDCAHNRDSAMRLRLALEAYFPGRPVQLVFGASEDKDIEGMLAELMAPVESVILSRSFHPRAAELEQLQKEAGRYGKPVSIVPDIADALDEALRDMDEVHILLITDSIFIVAGAREAWVARSGAMLEWS